MSWVAVVIVKGKGSCVCNFDIIPKYFSPLDDFNEEMEIEPINKFYDVCFYVMIWININLFPQHDFAIKVIEEL